MSEWYEREARRASLDDAAGRDLETGDDYDEPVLTGAELVAEHTGRPIADGGDPWNPNGPGGRQSKLSGAGDALRAAGTGRPIPTCDAPFRGYACDLPSGHGGAHLHRASDVSWVHGDPLVSDEERARREAVEAATGEPWCNHDAAAIGADGVCECGAMLVEEPEPDAEHEAFCEHYDAGEGR